MAAVAEAVDMKSLHELRSFRHPPAAVRQIAEAAMFLYKTENYIVLVCKIINRLYYANLHFYEQ